METLPSSAGDLSPDLFQRRQVTLHSSARGVPKLPRRATRNHLIRATAKHCAQTADPSYTCRDLGLTCQASLTGREPCTRCGPSAASRASRRRQLEQDLRRDPDFGDRIARRGRELHVKKHYNKALVRDDENPVALARSSVPLPSDSGHRRPPSLEREDAFREAATSRGNVRIRRAPASAEDDAQVAELYRMGLLYDDGDAAFTLDSIRHVEPVYTIRPAKRSRKHAGLHRKAHSFCEREHEPLHLNLSFTDLGSDETIAQLLAATAAATTTNTTARPDSPSALSRGSSEDDSALPTGESARAGAAPLRVIYEVDGSTPSFDVDTSQPPDLEPDLLSDYDCFSESDLDDDRDLPLQREVRDPAAAPASDAWVVLGDGS